MSFNSLQYALFLVVVVAVTWRLGHRRQNLWLLAASYLFYAAWDWRFLALLALSSVIGYTSGIALAATDDDARRRAIVASRVALNLGMLGLFKYAGFFVTSAAEALQAVGLTVGEPTLAIILPIAISYYTFEEIAYTVDIYRGDITPCRDPVSYGLFVAFFPKLVAGPILRPRELLPQIEQSRSRPDRPTVISALGLLLWGLVKKVVIADTLAVYVDEIYARPSSMSGAALIIGTLCFAGQIYGDFSGYTDMARGAARLLGFELPLNFRQPYLSSSLTAFWRTWHISLSSWLRDYLYVPLGGNRRSPRRTMVNLMTVMVLGGLWHGAGWTFLIWGAIHGVALAVERALGSALDNTWTVPGWRQVPRILVTFAVVCLAWVFFRAPDAGTAFTVVGRMASLASGEMVWGAAVWLAASGAVIVASDLIERRVQLSDPVAEPAGPGRGGPAPAVSERADVIRLMTARPVLSGVAVGLAVASVVIASGGAPVPFIYYQF